MLTPLTRRQLRDKVVREALRRGQPNPLVSGDERSDEEEGLISLIIEKYVENPDHWNRESQRFTRRIRILEKEKT